VKLFHGTETADEAVAEFSQKRFPGKDSAPLIKIMQLSDKAIKGLWYLPEFSEQVFFFRRLRIPPLLWIYWDTIIINATLRRILRRLVVNRKESIDDGFRILNNIKDMKDLASELRMDTHDFDFMYATFELLLKLRIYMLSDWTHDIKNTLDEYVRRYTHLNPNGFSINSDISTRRRGNRIINVFLKVILRTDPGYRPMEKMLYFLGFGAVRPIVYFWGRKRIPDFAAKRAMGIKTLLK
jgi:hypothetical protein